ncbi:MAG: hypothetical protein LBC93_05910, partial [Synergistaceae bacterium]|nr:hypothetical protein [Synergistaceae bacterium]
MSRKRKLSIAVCVTIPFAILLLIAAGGRQLRQSDASTNITANITESTESKEALINGVLRGLRPLGSRPLGSRPLGSRPLSRA